MMMPGGSRHAPADGQGGAVRTGTAPRLLLLAILLCTGFFSLVHLVQQAERNVFATRPYLAHDEAEHLHASFLLTIGQRPYDDFIENHPMLFNHLLNAVFELCGAETTRERFLAAKILIYGHFVVCLCVVFLVLRHARRNEGFSPPPSLLLVLSLAALAPWGNNNPIWEVRPDWLCHTYALLCVYLHWSAHARADSAGGPSAARLAVAGLLGGIGTAVLPKTVLIFLAYAAVVLTLPSVRLLVTDPERRGLVRRILLANGVFAAALLSGLAGGVMLDLTLSRVSFSEYWLSNVVMNSIPHLAYVPFINDVCNPIQRVRDLIGFSAALFLGLRVLCVPAIPLFSGDGGKPAFRPACYRFCFATIAVCIILPTFTNRLVWPQYFAPALLALLLMTALAMDDFFTLLLPRAGRAVGRFAPRAALRTPIAGALIGALLLLGPQIGRVRWDDFPFEKQLSLKPGYPQFHGAGRIDFLPDLFLPAGLVYWTFEPQMAPIHARHWSYFFMLALDRRLWNDAVKLGLAPELDQALRGSFLADPPDVVVLNGECDFVKWRHVLKLSNSYRLDWLWPLLCKDYVRAERSSMSVLIHARHAGLFRSLRWELSPLDETIDVIRHGCY